MGECLKVEGERERERGKKDGNYFVVIDSRYRTPINGSSCPPF